MRIGFLVTGIILLIVGGVMFLWGSSTVQSYSLAASNIPWYQYLLNPTAAQATSNYAQQMIGTGATVGVIGIVVAVAGLIVAVYGAAASSKTAIAPVVKQSE